MKEGYLFFNSEEGTKGLGGWEIERCHMLGILIVPICEETWLMKRHGKVRGTIPYRMTSRHIEQKQSIDFKKHEFSPTLPQRIKLDWYTPFE